MGRHPLLERASAAADGTSLAVVRVAFGLVGLLVVVRTVANGWVESLYAGPARHFTYSGFGWVGSPTVAGTCVLLAVIGVAAAFVAVGYRTRIALGIFLIGFAWLELVEVTTYLNHYWFVSLFGIVLLAVPASARWSLDARRRGPRSIPVGALWLVRAQVAVVYVFAGLAKLNADWLVHGQPLRMWLPRRSDLAIVGPWLDERWVALGLSWAGVAFDLLVVPALCWRKTAPVRVGRDRRVPRRHVVALPHRRVPVADDRGVDGVLRARMAQSPPHASAARANGSCRACAERVPVRANVGSDRATTAAARGRARRSRGSRSRCSSRSDTGSFRATTAGRTRVTASRGSCSSPRRAAT